MKKLLIGFKYPLKYPNLITSYSTESFIRIYIVIRCPFPPSIHCIHPLCFKTSTWKIPFQWKNEIEYTPQVTESSKDILLLKENLWQERTFGIHIPLIYCASLHNVFLNWVTSSTLKFLSTFQKKFHTCKIAYKWNKTLFLGISFLTKYDVNFSYKTHKVSMNRQNFL